MMDQRLSSGPRMPDSLNGEGALRKALDGPIDGRARKTSNTGDDGNTSSSQSLAIEGCNQVLLSLIEVRKQQGVLPLKFFGFAHSRIIPSPSSFVTLNFLRALRRQTRLRYLGGGAHDALPFDGWDTPGVEGVRDRASPRMTRGWPSSPSTARFTRTTRKRRVVSRHRLKVREAGVREKGLGATGELGQRDHEVVYRRERIRPQAPGKGAFTGMLQS